MKCAWCGCEIKYPYVVLYPTKYELVDSGDESSFAASYSLKLTGDRVEKRLQHICDDNSISDCNAHRARQRQPAHQTAGLTQRSAPAGPCLTVGAQRSGAGAAANGIFRRKAYHTEQRHENQICDQKCTAAVSAHFCRETPDIRHTDRRADRRKNKAPATH